MLVLVFILLYHTWLQSLLKFFSHLIYLTSFYTFLKWKWKSLSHVWLFVTPCTAACQASLPSPSPGACSNSCLLSQWCHPSISSSVVPFSSCLQSFPASVFSSESVLCIRWPKYWIFSFSISPSNDYSGLISFRMDWFDLLAVQGTLEYPPTPQFKSINSSALSFLYSPTLTSIHDYWASLVAQLVKNLPAMPETWVLSLGWKDTLE